MTKAQMEVEAHVALVEGIKVKTKMYASLSLLLEGLHALTVVGLKLVNEEMKKKAGR
jgi:hypothetical protein